MRTINTNNGRGLPMRYLVTPKVNLKAEITFADAVEAEVNVGDEVQVGKRTYRIEEINEKRKAAGE